jgi:ATP-dependent RNA helicase RhlE
MSEITFADLPLVESLQRVLRENGYAKPSPIQAQAIPPLVEGRDLIGCAQTGTGKTAAFALPLLQKLAAPYRHAAREVRALILVPTRELAVQVDQSLETYGRHLNVRRALVYGGVSAVPQIRALKRGVDFLVATPGRLLDLHQQGHLDLSQAHHLVLDEVDQMLDMGFLPDVRRICALLPKDRQSLFFSATLAPAMKDLARSIVKDPIIIRIAPEQPTVERIHQQVCFTESKAKRALLEHLVETHAGELPDHRTLVFSRTKHGADRIAKQLSRAGVRAEAIHGNKSQNARQRALESFRDGRTPVLIATDVAARGLDIKGVSLVVNFDLPTVAETYVHRIGRTARANADGRAVSFCGEDDHGLLRDIQQLTRRSIEVHHAHPYHDSRIADGMAHANARGGSRATTRPPRHRPAQRTAYAGPRMDSNAGAEAAQGRRRRNRGFQKGRPARG